MPYNQDKLDIIKLLKKLWKNQNFLKRSLVLSFILGLLVALLSTNVYKAHTSFVPQIKSTKVASSSIKGLASLAGIDLTNIDTGSNELSPLIYPKIAKSKAFNLSLLSEKIYHKNKFIRLDSYYIEINKGFSISKLLSGIKKYTIGLPSLILSNNDLLISDNNIHIILTEQQTDLIESLEESISVDLNDKEGYLTIAAKDKDPLIATQLTQIVTSKLQKEIIQKRLEKANDNLKFVQVQYDSKNKEFQNIQNRLAKFKDRNQNISTAIFMNNLQRLEAEYSIALNVVQELASQVEQAKIQLNRDTPIFTVIESVVVPFKRSAPKRGLIVMTWMFFGIILSAGFILIKDQIIQIKAQITS